VEFRRDFRQLFNLICQVSRCPRNLNHPKLSQQLDLRRRAASRWALPHISSFYIFRHAIYELPRPITAKLCHIIARRVRFIMQVQKFGGPPPKEIGAKNLQNSVRFQTTSEIDRECLRNGSRYPKSDMKAINEESPVNFGPLTTKNLM